MQILNAEAPILITLFGIIIFFKLVQLENAAYPIFVILSGIAILVILIQSSNAKAPILITGKFLYSHGINTFVSLQVPIPISSYPPSINSNSNPSDSFSNSLHHLHIPSKYIWFTIDIIFCSSKILLHLEQ